MYIARVIVGGNSALYAASVLGQICFSGGLFMFWLVYADGMQSAPGVHSIVHSMVHYIVHYIVHSMVHSMVH